ncbi:MAG: hypothetical protein HN457_06895 [Opitutales bacterium]|nr:hypothetical protein [Opitutales bacterium]MBT6378662.1 hypothetical protein [Opitutales bacterium]
MRFFFGGLSQVFGWNLSSVEGGGGVSSWRATHGSNLRATSVGATTVGALCYLSGVVRAGAGSGWLGRARTSSKLLFEVLLGLLKLAGLIFKFSGVYFEG